MELGVRWACRTRLVTHGNINMLVSHVNKSVKNIKSVWRCRGRDDGIKQFSIVVVY